MGPTGRPSESAALVELGRVVNRHGVRGELRLRPHNPATTLLSGVSSVVVCGPGHHERSRRRVVSVRPHKRLVLLRLEGITTADDAQALIGCTISVPYDQMPPPGPNEVYHVDLIGRAVRTDTGLDLGTVREMIVTGSNDVCVVSGTGREYLIPLIEDVIVRLDPGPAEIIVHPLPGLLDQ